MDILDRWLAPGILVAVALGQLALANLGELSPWKGGGFGMFSTTDSLGARVVSCEGETVEGETIEIHAFAGIKPAVIDNWRAMPRQSTLRRLGAELLHAPFVPAGSRVDFVNLQFLGENPELAKEINPELPPGRQVYRPILAIDPPEAEAEAIRLRSIRLEWWKIEFDGATNQFRTVRIGEPVVLSNDASPSP